MSGWRYKDILTDEELLAAAEQAVLELENLPLDNSAVTDEEDSEDEAGEDFERSAEMSLTVDDAENDYRGNRQQNNETEHEVADEDVASEEQAETASIEGKEAAKSANKKLPKKNSKKLEENSRKWKKKKVQHLSLITVARKVP